MLKSNKKKHVKLTLTAFRSYTTKQIQDILDQGMIIWVYTSDGNNWKLENIDVDF
jgi:hypothetical protein